MAKISDKFLDSVYKLDSLIQEKYHVLGRDEQNAVWSPIVISGIMGTIYLSSIHGGLASFLPMLSSFGAVIYLDRKNIISDMGYNMLYSEMNSNCQ